MQIIQLAAIGLIGLIITVMLKRFLPDMSVLLAVAVGMCILLPVMPLIESAVESIIMLSQKYDINTEFVSISIKVIGIAYICRFASDLCRDCGQSAIASKVEFGGRIIILLYALPAAEKLLDMIVSILP